MFRHTDTQTPECYNPPPTLGLIIVIKNNNYKTKAELLLYI